METATTRREGNAEVRAWIAGERRELADLLESVRDDQWDRPSLCAGWRVSEVAAHMSMGFRLSLPATVGELVRARGNLHRMTDRVARRDAAAHSTAELAAFLREGAHHHWTPRSAGSRRRWATTWCTAWTSPSLSALVSVSPRNGCVCCSTGSGQAA